MTLPAPRRGRLLLGGLVILLLAVVAGLLLRDEAAPPPSASGPPATSGAAPAATRAAPFEPGEPPDRLVVPSIGLDAPVVPIAVDDEGVLTPPADTDVVGWWRESAHPGAPRGQTVLTGHTVSSGGGVMNALGDLEPGEEVLVRDDGRTVTYDVTEVFDHTRAEVAENAEALFGQGRPGGRLVLVTCTDWDGEVYRSNIIVFARPR